MKIKIDYLVDHPECIDSVVQWSQDQWGIYYPHFRRADWLEKLFLNNDIVPTTLIAFDTDTEIPKLVGTASLGIGGYPFGDENTVWLLAVYVPSEDRHKGVASELIKQCIEHARKYPGNGKIINKIMLLTYSSGEIYEKLGWKVIDKPIYREKEALLMAQVI